MKKVLNNDKSNANILFAHILPRLGTFKGKLKLVTTPTFRVSPSELLVLGWINLPLMLKGSSVKTKEDLFASIMARFIIINVPSSYKAILGRQSQGNLHLRIDVKYQMVMFEIKEGDAKIFINQDDVRKAFIRAW